MLEIKGLSKTYSNGVKALNNISLTIEPGIFGLLGPNGAGKSSLMRTLVTLQLPDAGSVHLNGIDITSEQEKARKQIGYLPQDFGLYPNVSAEALLDQFALYKGFTDSAERRDLVAAHLQMVNLFQHRKKHLGGFSGGMRQRFGIAQALLGSPTLLVVDEPTAGLDPTERLRIQSLLAELSENRVVLLSTHLVEDVLALCPRVAVMNQGSLVCSGSPEELMEELKGRIWRKQIGHQNEIADAWDVVSSRVALGKREVRVLADAAPDDEFNVAPVEFDDVYFTVLQTRDRVAQSC